MLLGLFWISLLPGCAFDTWVDLISARDAYDRCLKENAGDERACDEQLEASNEAYDAYQRDAGEDGACEFNEEGCGARGPAVDEYGRPK